jgi:hypothetical protein
MKKAQKVQSINTHKEKWKGDIVVSCTGNRNDRGTADKKRPASTVKKPGSKACNRSIMIHV